VTGPKDRDTMASGAPRSAEQRRAANALQAVAHSLPPPSYSKSIAPTPDRLGPAILMNGLGQALATERANNDEPAHHHLFHNLETWLCGEAGVYVTGDLLSAIVGGSEALYFARRPRRWPGWSGTRNSAAHTCQRRIARRTECARSTTACVTHRSAVIAARRSLVRQALRPVERGMDADRQRPK